MSSSLIHIGLNHISALLTYYLMRLGMSTILCRRFVYIVLQVIHKFWWFHLCQCCVCVCMYIHMCGFFFLIFSTDSEGSGNGSEDPSKDSGEGSCSDSEENILEEELSEDIKVKEEQLKNSTEEEIVPSDKQLIKMEKKEEEENGERPRKKKEKEKEKEKATVSDSAAASAATTTATNPPAVTSPSVPTTTTEEQVSEPKKWNLRRNRPLLDFVSMEELNDMDDYDSEDDNDWRPTVVKRKGRSASQKDGSDGDNEDDEDEGSGSDDDENDEGNDEDHSSPASEVGCKKKKSKVLSRNSADDEELTNDSLTLSQSKSNEVEQPDFYDICLSGEKGTL